MNTVSQIVRREGFFINGGRRFANTSPESSDERWRVKGVTETGSLKIVDPVQGLRWVSGRGIVVARVRDVIGSPQSPKRTSIMVPADLRFQNHHAFRHGLSRSCHRFVSAMDNQRTGASSQCAWCAGNCLLGLQLASKRQRSRELHEVFQ